MSIVVPSFDITGAPAVFDSTSLERQRRALLRELEEERFRTWVNLETQNSVFLLDERTDPTNTLARLGKPMTTEVLEEKLRRINPNLRFFYNRFNSTKKWCALYDPGEKKLVKLFPYEAGLMPERSIMSRRVLDVPDTHLPSVPHIERADLPDYEYIPGKGEFFDPSRPLPGFRRVEVPWREEVRGWRTVVLRLIVLGVIPATAAEKVFGPDDTPEWAGHMGKREKTRPW